MKKQQLLDKIKKEFPQLTWKKYKFFTNGWDHLVVIFDNQLVFRTPYKKNYQGKLKNEINLLKYLNRKISTSIPEYRFVSRDNVLVGYPMVPGRHLNVSYFNSLSKLDREKLTHQLAGFLSCLHNTPVTIIKKHKVKLVDQASKYGGVMQAAERYIYPRVRKKDMEAIRVYFVKLKKSLQYKYKKVLVHQDLLSEHILWDSRKKKLGVIDFSDRAFGDPALDFSGLFEYGEDFVKSVYKYYRGPKDQHLLERALLYYKQFPLWIMQDAFLGCPCTFKAGYVTFRKRFDV